MINLHYGDCYVMVEPEIPHEILKHLTYYKREMLPDPHNQYKRKMQGHTEYLYTQQKYIGEDGCLVTKTISLPGFAGLIRDKLKEFGCDVNIIDSRGKRPDYDLRKALSVLLNYQYECAHVALWSGGGVICCPTGWGKTYIIASLIKGYSHEDMLARDTRLSLEITPGEDLVRKNWEDLVELLPERDVGLVGGGVKQYSDDVQVVTPESMKNIEIEQAGIVIYDEVHTLTTGRADQVMRGDRAMRYGLSATPTGRYDNSDKVITSVFGPIIYKRTYQQAVDDGAILPIKVIWLYAPAPEPHREYKTKDGAYRNGLWTNKKFAEFFGELWASFDPELQILAVADKLKQLEYFGAYAEGTIQVHGKTPKKKRKEIYNELRDGELLRAMSTGIYRQGVSFPHLTALVNLAGMKSEIIAGQLPGRTSRKGEGKTCGYIIDFWCPWDIITNEETGVEKPGFILKDARSREKTYNEIGFEQQWIQDLNELQIV
jgi:superfamily II DNA or RNA helicase